MRKFAAWAFVLVAVPVVAQVQQPALIPAPVRAAADRITADQLKKDLDFFSSDKLEGRNTPSPGFDAAAEYIGDRLTRAGLKPLGDDGSFFQHYTMREASADTANAFVEIGGRRFAFGDSFVLRSFAGPIAGTFPMVYAGHGWVYDGGNPYADLDVRGKVIVVHGPRALPKGVQIRQIGRITPDASSAVTEAARRGAAGVIYLPLPAVLDGWDRMRTQNTRMRELEPSVPSAYAAQPATSLLLSDATAAALVATDAKAANLIALGAAQDYPASFEFSQPITISLPASSNVEHRPHNVVALLEGSDPVLKDEYVTVFSHLDGAVGTREVNGDRIYNSADDNASGSAGTLSIAEHMATVRPKRSIIFVWDSGEEQGLWGTRRFVGAPPVPLDRIVAHFNIDMIGANSAPGSVDAAEKEAAGPNEVYLIGPGVLSARTDELLARINAEYLGMTFRKDWDSADSEFFYPRTDAGPFLERGILTIGFTTGNHARYHLPADEAQFLDPTKIEAVARTVFVSLWMVANQDERPGIDKPIPETVPRYGGMTAGPQPEIQPSIHTYATRGGTELEAHVFTPAGATPDQPRAAIVIFHGGGWAEGDAEWAYPRAQHFASRGMVAIAAQYRLSNGKDITPIDSMADARAIIRWTRAEAASLGIDPGRIAAYGWSAGGHLAASAAVFDDADAAGVSSRPDALVLASPAVSLDADSWFQELLQGRGQVRDVSPDEHVRAGMPPTVIVQGDVDTVTPLDGVRRFCDRMNAAGNTCDLHVFKGFGHLFTPAGVRDDRQPAPDRTIAAEAMARADAFLKAHGFQD